MNFKVIIIIKLACYGIKIYAVTDANPDYIFNYVVYTGKYKVYSSTTNTEDKTTIWVVKSICETFRGTYHTIYIHSFYTSIDQLKNYDKFPFDIGTCMKNCILNGLNMTNISLENKEMSRR